MQTIGDSLAFPVPPKVVSISPKKKQALEKRILNGNSSHSREGFISQVGFEPTPESTNGAAIGFQSIINSHPPLGSTASASASIAAPIAMDGVESSHPHPVQPSLMATPPPAHTAASPAPRNYTTPSAGSAMVVSEEVLRQSQSLPSTPPLKSSAPPAVVPIVSITPGAMISPRLTPAAPPTGRSVVVRENSLEEPLLLEASAAGAGAANRKRKLTDALTAAASAPTGVVSTIVNTTTTATGTTAAASAPGGATVLASDSKSMKAAAPQVTVLQSNTTLSKPKREKRLKPTESDGAAGGEGNKPKIAPIFQKRPTVGGKRPPGMTGPTAQPTAPAPSASLTSAIGQFAAQSGTTGAAPTTTAAAALNTTTAATSTVGDSMSDGSAASKSPNKTSPARAKRTRKPTAGAGTGRGRKKSAPADSESESDTAAATATAATAKLDERERLIAEREAALSERESKLLALQQQMVPNGVTAASAAAASSAAAAATSNSNSMIALQNRLSDLQREYSEHQTKVTSIVTELIRDLTKKRLKARQTRLAKQKQEIGRVVPRMYVVRRWILDMRLMIMR